MSYDSKPNCTDSYNIPDTLPESPDTDISMYYNNGKGIIKQAYTEYWNKNNRTWNNANAYIDAIVAAAANDATDMANLLKPSAIGSTDSNIVIEDINIQNKKDSELLDGLKKEYCFYRVRYEAFLNAFLESMSNNTANAEKLLAVLISLNSKMNAFTTLVDHFANNRAAIINYRTQAFNNMNEELDKQFNDITSTDLQSKESVLNTRKEMIRYTKEKNNSITNHISLWAALNVVAIAMIFTLYRKL